MYLIFIFVFISIANNNSFSNPSLTEWIPEKRPRFMNGLTDSLQQNFKNEVTASTMTNDKIIKLQNISRTSIKPTSILTTPTSLVELRSETQTGEV